MPTWNDRRTREFAKQLRLWGVLVSKNGVDVEAIKTPDVKMNVMGPSTYSERIKTRVDMFRSEFAKLQLSARNTFTITARAEGSKTFTYEVNTIFDDQTEPTVWFDAYKVS